MRVLLLGPFEVRGDDDRPIEVAGTRLRALLARLSATEERLAAELATGADVLGELRPLADAHPLAERLQGLLIHRRFALRRGP
ncbi:BTAD domain-containing putative transcriptional regulator [Nonomuraea roseola]|uniref:BTAD domain-containing putative transcriptional regulator n=1 Tax=Nonomuraea roseola TaxID=46179 RepID=A0ABV5Q3T7_9ACTN